MAEKHETQSKVKEITDQLESGIKDLFTSEKYTEYLSTMSKFHNYSTRNTILIYQQMPDASKVAGFHTWKDDFERHVKKGEKGIWILAPIITKAKKAMEKLDPDTQTPLLDENGNIIIEEVEVTIPRFKAVPVFDVSQTDGKELPSIVEDLSGDVQQYEIFLEALKQISPLPIEFEPLGDADGKCQFGVKISIRENMSEAQTICAVIHEIAHAKLHDFNELQDNAENTIRKDKQTKEVEAESVAYAVCQYYGIETGTNSFGYIATWSSSRNLPELQDSLNVIRKTSASLIHSIDEKFREIIKEREIDIATKTIITEPPVQVDRKSPDPSIGLSEMNRYGYIGEDVFPLRPERALELFDADHTIYMLHTDSTESMVFDREEILSFDGIFGMESLDWTASKEYADIMKAMNTGEASKESTLIHGNENSYAIYQLKQGDETRYHRFESLDRLYKSGLEVDRSNYELVYTAPLEVNDTNTALNAVYETFNINHPDDFTGHSLSVSDVIVLQQDGEISSHYVDSIGFTQLTSFLGNETIVSNEYAEANKNSELSPEFLTQSKPEQEIPITEQIEKDSVSKGRTSILSQLEKYKNDISKDKTQQKATPKSNMNKEV